MRNRVTKTEREAKCLSLSLPTRQRRLCHNQLNQGVVVRRHPFSFFSLRHSLARASLTTTFSIACHHSFITHEHTSPALSSPGPTHQTLPQTKRLALFLCRSLSLTHRTYTSPYRPTYALLSSHIHTIASLSAVGHAVHSYVHRAGTSRPNNSSFHRPRLDTH